MTRFFISIEEAINLTRFAIQNGGSSEIFVPKMKSILIKDVFCYLRPEYIPDETPVKQGEKMHEEMLSEPELLNTHDLGSFLAVNCNGNNTYLDHFPKVKMKSYRSDTSEKFTKDEFLDKVNTSMITEINKLF